MQVLDKKFVAKIHMSYQKSFDTIEIFYPAILKYLSGSHMSNPIVGKFVFMCYE